MQHSQIVRFLWRVADLIRGTFNRGKYQDVILPLTVLRRLDCILAPSKQSLLDANARYGDKLDNLDGLLRKRSGFAFYNISRYDFEKLVQDAPHLKDNLLNYIYGFSPNVREVLEKFDFYNTIDKLDESGLLFQVMECFTNVDLHADAVSNDTMGTIFEELLRRFAETLDESASEHFTPRDVVHLMAELMLSGDAERLRRPGVVTTVSDPCCGTGGMLTITKDHILGSEDRQGVNPEAHVHLFGQEVNPETYAVCKADLFMKDPSGWDVDRILYGSVLEADGHSGRHFDYQIANPPYGRNWKRDEYAVESEARKGAAGRFPAGTPRISDGQFLFLEHMLTHMKPPAEGGSRVAMITNGSPLFTGDAGSGESEIRRWILENDWLEALVALPEQLFYNTSIATYVWVLSNRKPTERQGRVLLVDATDLWQPMRKSLGNKRREIADDQAAEIVALLENYEEGERSKILFTTNFSYRKIRVERPLRLNFQASAARIALLQDKRAFQSLAKGNQRSNATRAGTEAQGRLEQKAVLEMLEGLGGDLFKNRQAFRIALDKAAQIADVKLPAGLRKAIESSLSQPDEEAEVCCDEKGNVEPDPVLRDYEIVPLNRAVDEYFATEIKPYASDAWFDSSYIDCRDGGIGRVHFDIDFRIFGLRRLQIRAREANLVPHGWREVVEEIAGADRARDGVSSPMTTIYVPRTARGGVRLPKGELKNPGGYYEFRLRSRGPTTPRYLAAYLNSAEGQMFRKALSRGAAIDQISRRDWRAATFYLPPIQEQRESEQLLGDIRSMEAGLETIRRKLWSSPRQVSQLRSQLEAINPARSTMEWLDALPFPLASVLWTARTAASGSLERLTHLQHFFEATAEFLALVLLSGFTNLPEIFSVEKKRILEELERSKLSLETASFGTWVVISGRLAKHLRASLNSGADSQVQALSAFGAQAVEVLENLASSTVIGILQQANSYRNRVGHGGALNYREIREGCSFLEGLVEDYRAKVGGLWETWVLILPDHSRFDGEAHEYACELAVGSRIPFEGVKLRLRDHAVSGRLHLYDRTGERALPLLALVKLTRSPGAGHRACYFFSRRIGESVRFVSYHLSSHMEIIEQDGAAIEALERITSVHPEK